MINFPIVLGELAPQTPWVITTDSNYTLFRPLDLGKVKYSSVSKVKKGSTVESKLGLVSPLYHLISRPTALRAVRSMAAARAIYISS